MALRKSAHQLFTDREEPRQAFWNTLRKLEENPGSSQIITYYGEGGIGKSWLLQDIKRRVERLDPLGNESFFDDGFVFRGSYVPVFYNMETSIDEIEILCQLRYSIYRADKTLAFPVFDYAVSKYKELTGQDHVLNKESGSSVLARFENLLDLGSMVYSGIGAYKAVYDAAKTGAKALALDTLLSKIKDAVKRNKYKEYFESIETCGYAEDILINMAEYFKADLNLQERDFSFVFLIDTFEQMTYSAGLYSHAWLTDELAKETENTVWVFAGRNRIYKNFDNEHLLGDLSKEDTEYYLRAKAEITDEAVIQRIREISGGTPVFLDLCVQNYRNEGYPSIEEFRNTDKEQLIRRYVKYLSDAEKLVIRLMSSMGHWTDDDYREVFNKVHNGSFSQYHEAYNRVISSTMIEKDNEERYFLHNAVRTGIYEDPDYPDEIRWDSQDAMLGVYVNRTYSHIDPVYYASRYIDLIQTMAQKDENFDDDLAGYFAYSLIILTYDLYAKGRKPLVAWFYEQVKEPVIKLNRSETQGAYIALFLAHAAMRCDSMETAMNWARTAIGPFRRLYGRGSRATVLAERIFALGNAAKGRYRKGLEQLEECLKTFKEKYPDLDPEKDVATIGINLDMDLCRRILGCPEYELEKSLDDNVEKFGWEDRRTLMTAQLYASALSNAGRFREAADLLQTAYDTCSESVGEDDSLTVMLASDLAVAYGQAGEKERAYELLEETQKTAGKLCTGDDQITAFVLKDRGYLYYLDGKYEEALQGFEKALSIFGRYDTKAADDNIAQIYGYMAEVYRMIQKYDEAYEKYGQAFEILAEQAELRRPHMISLLAMRGYCLLHMSQPDRARWMCEESWRVIQEMNDGRAPYTYQVGWALSEVYAELNIENEDAEQFYTDLGKYFRAVHNDKEKADYFAQKARAIRRKRLS